MTSPTDTPHSRAELEETASLESNQINQNYQSNNEKIKPIAAQDRITVMDLLRGFALIGILFMNIEWFNRPISELLSFDFSEVGADYASSWLVMVFIQGKFYKLFSLLFGMGFAVMLLRAEEKGMPFKAWFTRRMLVLYVIGIAHMTFLWGGDILHDYAVGGMMMLGIVLLMRTKRFAKRNHPAAYAKIGFYLILVPWVISLLVGVFFGAVNDQVDMKESWENNKKVSFQTEQLINKAKADGTWLLTKEQYEVLEKESEALSEEATDVSEVASEELSTLSAEPETQALETAIDVTELVVEEVVELASDEVAELESEGAVVEEEPTSAELAFEAFERKQKSHYRLEKERTAFLQTSYWDVTEYRWAYTVKKLPQSIFFALFVCLPIFLLGYWLVASGRMREPAKHKKFFDVVCWGGLSLGLVLSIGGAMIINHPATTDADQIAGAANSLFFLGQMVLCAGYLGGIVKASQTAFFNKAFGWLAPLGKMALTNYIMHSVILTTLFYGYGFGLFGSVPRSEQMLWVVAIIAVQAVFSIYWLKAFRYGPLEWVWRCLTYLKLQPMRHGA